MRQRRTDAAAHLLADERGAQRVLAPPPERRCHRRAARRHRPQVEIEQPHVVLAEPVTQQVVEGER